jgi:hypothetical protein
VPAPTVSLTDDERRLVFSRLGNRLRIAGTAEFNGYNLDLNGALSGPDAIVRVSCFPVCKSLASRISGVACARPRPSNVPMHRPLVLQQPVAQHRTRDAGLDHVLWFGGIACRDDERPLA